MIIRSAEFYGYKYYWVTKKFWIFQYQVSPSIFYTYKDAVNWIKRNK